MGTRSRQQPERLAEKLLRIRTTLSLSQSEMLKRLGFEEAIPYTKISHYELGKREPTLPILLEYARLANVYMEVLVDDELDLPERLPSSTKSEGINRRSMRRSKQKRDKR